MPKIRATVCIPWRPQPERMAAHEKVIEFWQSITNFEIIEMDSDRNLPFSLAEARNRAVDHADGEVCIVADADTIPELPAVIGAMQYAKTHESLVYPFTEYHYVTQGALRHAIDPAALAAIKPLWTKRDAVGGIFVIQRRTYWDFGGSDERLERTWGFEDNCMFDAAMTLASVHRIPGQVWSFHHRVDGGRDWSPSNPNYHRARLYQMCRNDPALMRELIKR